MMSNHDIPALMPIVNHLVGKMAHHLNADDADDLRQDIVLCLLEALPQYDAGRNTSLTSWAYSVVHNRIVDHFRRLTRGATSCENVDVGEIDGPLGSNDTAPEPLLSIDSATLAKVLTRRQRQVYEALVTGQHERRHVAAQLGIRPDSLSQALGRITTRLREHLGPKMLKRIAA